MEQTGLDHVQHRRGVSTTNLLAVGWLVCLFVVGCLCFFSFFFLFFFNMVVSLNFCIRADAYAMRISVKRLVLHGNIQSHLTVYDVFITRRYVKLPIFLGLRTIVKCLKASLNIFRIIESVSHLLQTYAGIG